MGGNYKLLLVVLHASNMYYGMHSIALAVVVRTRAPHVELKNVQ